jgi:hypothetical protein
MSYKFLNRPFEDGAYEPEGIYLNLPLDGDGLVVQLWGENSEHYAHFTYNGVSLKGHNGIDFLVNPGINVLAVDPGRVTAIGEERGGLGRYVKLEHRWGESLYAHVDTILLDAGQLVDYTNRATLRPTYLHFAIRIKPFNRFDGWGGFVDPLPYLNPTRLQFVADLPPEQTPTLPPHAMIREQGQSRRP